MSLVKPFRGLRPAPGQEEAVASPPYDVLNAIEARALVARHPNSFLRVNKAELELDDGADPHSDAVYDRARANLDRLVAEGLMQRDERPGFYLYRLTMSGRSQTGLVALSSVAEYDAGRIKKHEHTRPDKVADRARHIERLGAQVGPVFSAFRETGRILDLFGTLTTAMPNADFTADDGVRHQLWVIDDPAALDQITEAFAELPCLYIADGHHRSEAASAVCGRIREANPNHSGDESYSFFLNVMFPAGELRILPYNRVVRDTMGLSVEELIGRTVDTFDATPSLEPVVPEVPHTFGLYGSTHWFRLTAREGSFDPNDPTGSIDAAILGANLLGPVLGITDPRTDDRIAFVGGIRGARELVRLVDSGEFAVAFALCATSIEQLLRVADAGDVMPPKSTWFEPKLRSGLVVNLLSE